MVGTQRQVPAGPCPERCLKQKAARTGLPSMEGLTGAADYRKIPQRDSDASPAVVQIDLSFS